jgi:hypothetical protein
LKKIQKSVETVPGTGEGEMKESSGGSEFKYNTFDIFKNFC